MKRMRESNQKSGSGAIETMKRKSETGDNNRSLGINSSGRSAVGKKEQPLRLFKIESLGRRDQRIGGGVCKKVN